MRNRIIKGKMWGPQEELESVRSHLESTFDCILSPIKNSDQGDCHFFFTLFTEANR